MKTLLLFLLLTLLPGESPAPEGYSVCYVSHYARHGDRYPLHDVYREPVRELERLHEAGLLTPRGEALRLAADSLRKASTGHWGQLLPSGRAQHRAVAFGLYGRYPDLFPEGAVCRVMASTAARCKGSRDSFLEGLKEASGGLSAASRVSPRMRRVPARDVSAWSDSIARAHLHPDMVLKSLVTDVPAALGLLRDPLRFEQQIYEMAVSLPVHPLAAGLFSTDEAQQIQRLREAAFWYRHGWTARFGTPGARQGRFLARDLVRKADSALREGSPAADFRFGHDSGLMALAIAIGEEGFDRPLAWEDGTPFPAIPMASTLVLVFYRNDAGEVLVKLLHDGAERPIPALGPGPFYPWTAVRARLLGW